VPAAHARGSDPSAGATSYLAQVTLNELLRLAPIAFHATQEPNLADIIARKSLLSPSEAYRLHGVRAPHVLRRSNGGSVRHTVPLTGLPVHLCDHDRLHAGNIRFDVGWDMFRLIELLDGLVFFWPGTLARPSRQGVSHWARYAKEGKRLAVLRVPMADLVAVCGTPRLSSCNSGAPRQHPKSGARPRGAETFRPLAAFSPSVEEIVEVVFDREVALPRSTERAESYAGPWVPLFNP